jgi:hypothetical protein
VPQEWYQNLEQGAGASPSSGGDDPILRPLPSPATPNRLPDLPTPPAPAPVSSPTPTPEPAKQRQKGAAPQEPFLGPDDFSSKPISIQPITKLTTTDSPAQIAVRLRASTRLPVIVPLDHKPRSDQSELPKIVPAGIKN